MLNFRKGQDENIAPHRTAPLLLLLTTLLVACGSQSVVGQNQRLIEMDEGALLSPRDMPVVHTRNVSGLQALSKVDASAVTRDGWVEHTFSNGEKFLFRNYKGMAVLGDVAYAPTKDMAKYIQQFERPLNDKEMGAQSLGLNPQGCSSRFAFFSCSIPTNAYMWAGHRVDYYFGNGTNGEFTQAQKDSITAQINTWNNSGASIKWYPSSVAANSKVGFFPSIDESYCGQAYIGYQGRLGVPNLNYININVNNPNSPSTCISPSIGTVNHEMGHVVGLPHEQNRNDRDTFVVLGVGYENQSQKKTGDDVKYYGGFDYDSIMIYESPYIWANPVEPASNTFVGYYPTRLPGDPGGRISRKSVLTATDVATINGIYNSPYNPSP